ncbi:MAG: quinoprotein dehydrogenase-associated putative ABC transporter substrate-binding protein [Acidobacteria bacterium]|nr:quinoprotein dehydrogenase-associated putative ABC transporter substrate-binding protein [Acidobacteriota bacterium]
MTCTSSGVLAARGLLVVGACSLPAALALSVALAPSTGAVFAQSPELRVCGDPDNLPYSNERLEGFENRIAAVVAAELGATPVYAWWPHQRGLVRNTIDAGTCDVIFGVPEGLDFVLWTKPYYRSSYVMAYRDDRGYDLPSLDAPALQQLRIGVHVNTPPEESLARRGLLDNVSTYSLFFDPRGDRDRPRKLLDDLVAGTVDVAVAWGPLAGYAAATSGAPLELVPLEDEPGVPLSFDISMGVAKGNEALKDRLETAIDRRRTEILAILEEYGVPLVPAGGGAAAAPAAGVSGAADPNAEAAPEEAAQLEPPSAAAAADPGPTPGPRKLNPFTGNADMAAEGRTLYFQVGCQGCHGGGGGGGMATSVIDDAWTFGSDDDVLFRLIKGEIPEQTMPTVYSVLEDEEVWQILAFIRSVYAGDPGRIDW